MQAVAPDSAPRHVAIIGTAGRDRARRNDAAMWQAMVDDVRARVQPTDILVSGGAALSDHLAVTCFLNGWVSGLRLYLPAPLRDGAFVEVSRSRCSGSVANYYHRLFREAAGVDGLAELCEAAARGAVAYQHPAAAGFTGMFARNKLVARDATSALAYTWGGAEPQDGGTRMTWDAMGAIPKVHVSLVDLASQIEAQACDERPRTASPAP